MKRQESKDGPPVLLLNSAREDKRRKSKYTGRYNYLHDTVVNKLDHVMRHYPTGEFDTYQKKWRKTDAYAANRPSRFLDTRKVRMFKTDRFDDFQQFLYNVMDHIRQSINMLKNYQDAHSLRVEYEQLLEDPYLLMRYYRRRFKDVGVQQILYQEAQLNVVPKLKPFIIDYIERYDYASNESVRPIQRIDQFATSIELDVYLVVESTIYDIIDSVISNIGNDVEGFYEE